MPANTQHPLYANMSNIWERMRDCVAGEDAVKARGPRYLPILSEQEDSEYGAYKTRATFYSASGRTVDGLQGAIQRKPPKIEWPASQKERLKNIGRAGESLDHLTSSTIRDNLTTGRFGLLVDAPPADEGEYPAYVVVFAAESIINWRQAVVDGQKKLALVVLSETYEEIDPKDPYVLTVKPQWRCLHLGTGPAYDTKSKRPTIAPGFYESDLEDPFYYQEIWRENPDKQAKDKMILVATIVPRKMGGRLWTEIPFAFANAAGNEPDPVEPPLLDLANVNLSHYRNSADLEHGLHFTALPTAWFAGFEFDGEVHLGSTVAYSTTRPDAKAGFLEFTGQGLKGLSDALLAKEKQMATLGSRMLEQQKAGTETAQSQALRSAGEQSALTLVAKACSEAWTSALRWLHQWGEASDDASKKIMVTLNTEFTVTTLAGPELQALIQAAQSGLMSWETFFHNLQRGGIIPDGRTADEERSAIEDEGLPAGLGLTLAGPGLPGAEPPTPAGEPEEDDPEDEDEMMDEDTPPPKAKMPAKG